MIEAPLQVDENKIGENSDHKMVLLKPLNNIENKIAIEMKTIEVSEENF